MLRSSWYLPPSRHSCLSPSSAASSHNLSINTAQEGGQQLRLRPRKKRTLSLTYEDNISNAKILKADADLPLSKLKIEGTEKTDTAKFFPCPLDGCSRKCETKKLLMLHLALSHFLVKMESSYTSSAGKVDTSSSYDNANF